MEEKMICCRCERELPLTEEYFYKDESKKNGFNRTCKVCRKKYNTENKDRFNERRRQLRLERNPITEEDLTTKVCTKCGERFPATNEYFNKSKTGKFGLKSLCKKCAYQECVELRAKKKELKMQNAEIIPDGMKKCTKCQQIKPATTEYFNNKKSGKYGLTGMCRECLKYIKRQNFERDSEKSKQWRENNKEYCELYREENKERINAYNKQYQETHKEQRKKYYLIYREKNKEILNELSKQKYYSNIEYERDRSRKYYHSHKTKHRASVKRWGEKNKELLKLYQQKRKSIEKQLESSLTIEQWEQIELDFNNKCAYCGKSKKLTIDHFIPLSKFGELSVNNVIPACKSCNSSKNNKDFFEWYPNYMHYSKKRENFILKYLNYTNNGEQQLSIAL